MIALKFLPVLLFLAGTALISQETEALFTRGFYKFLIQQYGNTNATMLYEGGGGGSYGGGSSSNKIKTNFRPVVMIHGLGGSAEPKFTHYYDDDTANFNTNDIHLFREAYMNLGYKSPEIYATSFFPMENGSYLMPCARVQRFRLLIQAVHKYTGSLVDILGISLGGVVGRKAVLGGICVDTGEDLGAPLTDIVHTFVSVAGPQRGGANICPAVAKCCDPEIGLACNSSFLADINNPSSPTHYEGQVVYTIYSKDDDLVGYKVCGNDNQLACEIPGEDTAHVKHNLGHGSVIFDTMNLQFLLHNHDQAGLPQAD